MIAQSIARLLRVQAASSWSRHIPRTDAEDGRQCLRTGNIKNMRRVIGAAILGLPPGDTTGLENPAAAEAIAALGGQSRNQP